MQVRASNSLQRVQRLLKTIEDGTLIALLAAMIAVAVAQIVMRNILGTGIAWGDPLLRILVLWVGLAGAIVATREDHHISIDVLTHLLPASLRSISKKCTTVFASVVCGIVGYHAARFVYGEYEAQTIAFATVPTWVCQLILPIAFTVMSLRFLALAFQSNHEQKAGASNT